MLDDEENYRGKISELDSINENNIQTAGQIRYLVVEINGHSWGFTAPLTSNPDTSLAQIQNKVATHLSSGAAADQTTLTANDIAKMQYDNDTALNLTVGLPFDKIAEQTIKLTKLKTRLKTPGEIALANQQIADNNVRMAKLQAAMAGGGRRRKHKDKHSRSKRRRLLKKAKRHSKTRRSRR
jgi:hypothetical protein